MAPVEIQTGKPINTSQRSPTSSHPHSRNSSVPPSPTKTAAKALHSPSTLAPPPASGSSTATSRYAPASPTSTSATPTLAPAAQPGAAVGPTPTGTAVPPPPRSPTRTTNPIQPPGLSGPPSPRPGPTPAAGAITAQGLLSAQPGGTPPPPQPSPAPSLSHPPGYHQSQSAGAPIGGTASAVNTSMGMGSLTPLSISRNPSPVSAVRNQSHRRNMSGAGLLDPGSGGLLTGVLPDGAAEQAGNAWTAVKGWVGSTASTVGQKAVEVEGQVWRKVNGE